MRFRTVDARELVVANEGPASPISALNFVSARVMCWWPAPVPGSAWEASGDPGSMMSDDALRSRP